MFTTKTLGQICDKVSGTIRTGPFGSQLHEADYKPEGIPVVMPKDIVEGKVSQASIARISEEDAHRLAQHKLRSGEIVYGRRGDIGRQALIGEAEEGWLCGTGCLRIGLGSSVLNSLYLHYYLQQSDVIQWIANKAIGATLPNLNTAILRSVPIAYPALSTQCKIAAVLSAYDGLIENNARRIALLEKMAEEVYREWFVRLRFPGHENMPVHQGVPEGWQKVPVDGAFEFTGGGTPSKEEKKFWEGGEINWYTPTDITAAEGMFLSSSGLKCTEEGLANSSARLFPAHSLMMTSRATIGAIGINTTPACTNQGFITCVPNGNFPLTFLYFWLKSNKSYFEALSTGSTFLELIKSRFKRIEIIKPAPKIVEAYDSATSPIFRMIETLLEDNKNLRRTRDMLLSRLLSGKLDVENLDIQYPPGMRAPE